MTKPIVGGKPLKFETPDDLITCIQKYLDDTPESEYTITGLALAIGTRQLVADYEKRDEYRHIIQKARLIIENGYEKDIKLGNGNATTIFVLKNMGWKDKQEVEHSGEMKGLVVVRPEGRE